MKSKTHRDDIIKQCSRSFKYHFIKVQMVNKHKTCFAPLVTIELPLEATAHLPISPLFYL